MVDAARATQRRLLAMALGLVVMAAAGPALAQRGEDFAPIEELAASPNPNRGFPGLLDTEVAPKGAFVANLPATSLYYGVTPRLTLGTIAGAFATVFFGTPGASVHARYLLGGASWFRSTADALLLATAVEENGGLTNVRVGLFSSNTELLLNRSNRLTAHAWLLRIAEVGSQSSAVATRVMVGGTYSVALTNWAALHATALYIASRTGSDESPGAIIDSDSTDEKSPLARVIARVALSMRRGRWLFDVGAVRVDPWVLPWFNVAVQLGT